MDDTPATRLKATPESQALETLVESEDTSPYHRQWFNQAWGDFGSMVRQEKTFSGIAGIIVLIVAVGLFLLQPQSWLSLLPVGVLAIVVASYVAYVFFRAPRRIDERKWIVAQKQVAALATQVDLVNRELQLEKAKHLRPEITGQIEEVYADRIMDLPPDKDTPPEWNCFITIKAHVFNRQSVPTTIKLTLEVTTATGNIQAKRISLGDLRLKHHELDTAAVPQMSQLKAIIEQMPELAPTGRFLLAHGQEGWLRFIVAEDEAALRDIEALTLIATDDYGTSHQIYLDRSKWSQSGELVRQRDLDHDAYIARIYNEAFRC